MNKVHKHRLKHCIILSHHTNFITVFFYLHSGGWSPNGSPLGTLATEWTIVPAPSDDDGEFGGMKIGRGN
jgi:hypothetical protein